MPTLPCPKKITAILATAILPLLATAHAAEHNGRDDLTELSLADLAQVTVVAASKKEQHISQVAASAFVISHDEIHRHGYRTLGEALGRISGMYLSSDRNYDYLGVRGYSLPGDYNTRILLLIDGHRSNNALYDQAYMEGGFPVDLESIDRIEVVKGPGSALWGNNALLAVVNVITKKGKDLDGGRIMAETGSHQHRKLYLEYGQIAANGLSLAGSLSALDAAGENHIYFPELDQPNFNNGVAQDVDGEQAYKGYLSLAYKNFGLLFTHAKRTKTPPPAAWDGAFNDPNAYTVDKTTALEVTYSTNLLAEGNGHLFTRLYHDRAAYYGDYPYHENAGWSGDTITNKDEGSSRQWGGEIRYSMAPWQNLSLTVGLEYLDVYQVIQKNWDAPPYSSVALDTSANQGTYAISSGYAQGEYNLLANVTLIAGLRHDDYSTFGSQWSPRAALLYSPRLTTTLKLLYGEAFRAPNDYERNYDDGSYMVGNTSLGPEDIQTWELVCEQNFGNHTRLVASIFRFEMHNQITQQTIPGDLLQFQNNPDEVRSDGAELQLETTFDNDLSGYLSLSTENTKNRTTGSRLDNSPTVLAAGGLSMPLWDEKLHLAPEVRFIGKRNSTATGETLAATTTANLSLTADSLFGNLDLSFNIYNLFNRRHTTPGAGEHYHYDNASDTYLYFDIPQDGRTFRCQLSCRF